MAEQMLIDLRALLVEREDCDAGTVQKLRDGLAQGKTQNRSLKEATELLKKKLEGASGPAVKKWHLKLGIASFFLGHLSEAAEHLHQAEGALASFYLGKALMERQDLDEAQKAFEKAEKSGYTASQVQLQRAGINRLKGDVTQARALLAKLEDQASHNAEYHFQLAGCYLTEGNRAQAVRHLERAVELDPGHTGALFQLGHANDLAGNDDEAIALYERCLNHPPLHAGVLMNLGILYEDNDKYEQSVDCFKRILTLNSEEEAGLNPELQKDRLKARTLAREQARLFLKDSQASLTMYYSPDQDMASSRFSQVMEIPVTDFELSVRSRNCLKKMNIRTLGDLTRIGEGQLLASKNFGETSLTEIKEILGSKGLRLGQSLEEGAQLERRYFGQQPLSDQEQAVLNKPVADLNLSVRARKCMNRLGINTLGELIQRTADELLESKNFGMTSLNEVRDKLRQFGLSLRGD
ncbi:MAG: tetratricopeptide repeat protein [Planctomycetes bacterium]|nr:tetratricopeptide repeat protein [Planctomycetota bacterium]